MSNPETALQNLRFLKGIDLIDVDLKNAETLKPFLPGQGGRFALDLSSVELQREGEAGYLEEWVGVQWEELTTSRR